MQSIRRKSLRVIEVVELGKEEEVHVKHHIYYVEEKDVKVQTAQRYSSLGQRFMRLWREFCRDVFRSEDLLFNTQK